MDQKQDTTSSAAIINNIQKKKTCPVSWGYRIHRCTSAEGQDLPPNECPGYDTKQSDGELTVRLEL